MDKIESSSLLSAETDALAQILWDYCLMGHHLQKSEAIFALCSMDTRVAERAAVLFLEGWGEYLIFSGGLGRLTKDVFNKPEAEVFADIARRMGVPEEKMILENRSSNTGENIQFTATLLAQRGLHPQRMLLVQKPYMERRTYATFKKQWPDSQTEILVTSPQISFDHYCNTVYPKELIINVMVGDVQRIREYPKLGFQIAQEIPDKVWQAYEALVARGFTAHLI